MSSQYTRRNEKDTRLPKVNLRWLINYSKTAVPKKTYKTTLIENLKFCYKSGLKYFRESSGFEKSGKTFQSPEAGVQEIKPNSGILIDPPVYF